MAVHPTALVDRGAELGPDVEIGPFTIVGPGVVMHRGVEIGSHCVIKGPTVLGENTRVFHHAVLGEDPQDRKYKGELTRLDVGANNVFREFVTINRGTVSGGGVTSIGNQNLFMAYTHVAHDCIVGNGCVLANCASLSGHVRLDDNVILGGLSGVHQHSRIGRCAMLGGGGMAAQDVPPFAIAQGDRARLYGLNIVGMRRNGFALETVNALKGAYRELFNRGVPIRIALEQVREVYADVPEVLELCAFIEQSDRGVCRSVGAEQATDG